MKKQKYRVLRTIASGSTSVIYEAIQTSLDRKVIIKKLHPHLTSDPDFISRFEMEAKTAASLNHENIVSIIDSGKQNGSYYIVMEYIEGVSLRSLMDGRGAVDEEVSMLIAHGICKGMNHAHGNGIIHRDIKPDNIMISRDGVVKITDFGLAKLIRGQVGQTQAGALLGTPIYMSPEQAIGEKLDRRSDIFSLGTICYEMVTGKQPFSGENYAAVIQKITSSSVRNLSRALSGSAEAGRIITNALNRNPDRRYRSGEDMAADIERYLGRDKIISARDILKSYIFDNRPVPVRRRKRGRRKKRNLARIAAAVIICLGLVAVSLNPGQVSSVIDNLRTEGGAGSGAGGLRADMSGSGGFGFTGIKPEPPAADNSISAAVDSTEMPEKESAPPDTSDTDKATPPAGQPAPKEKEPEPEPVREEAESGYLDVHVKPEAAIFVDGKQEIFGNHLGPMPIKPGRHSLLIRRTNYENYTEVINIKSDELSRRRIQLIPVRGRINVITVEGARLFIDGEFVTSTPLSSPVTVESGEHTVKLVKQGYVTWENRVEVQPRKTLRLPITLVRE